MTKNIKKTIPRKYLISDLNGEEFIGTFNEKVLQKTRPTEFRIEKCQMIIHSIAGLA